MGPRRHGLHPRGHADLGRLLATGSLVSPEVWKEATTDMVPFVFGGNYNGPGQWLNALGFDETGGFYGAEGSFAGYESSTMYSPTLDTTIAVATTKMPSAINPPPMMQALAIAVYGDDVDFGLTLDQAMEPNLGAGHERRPGNDHGFDRRVGDLARSRRALNESAEGGVGGVTSATEPFANCSEEAHVRSCARRKCQGDHRDRSARALPEITRSSPCLDPCVSAGQPRLRRRRGAHRMPVPRADPPGCTVDAATHVASAPSPDSSTLTLPHRQGSRGRGRIVESDIGRQAVALDGHERTAQLLRVPGRRLRRWTPHCPLAPTRCGRPGGRGRSRCGGAVLRVPTRAAVSLAGCHPGPAGRVSTTTTSAPTPTTTTPAPTTTTPAPTTTTRPDTPPSDDAPEDHPDDGDGDGGGDTDGMEPDPQTTMSPPNRIHATRWRTVPR